MRNIRIIAFIYVALFTACTAVDQPMTAEEKTQIESDVTKAFENMLDVMLDLNYDTFSPFLKLDDDFSTMMDGTISIGGNKAAEMFKGSFDYIKEFIFADMIEQDIIALDKNSAVILCSFKEAYVTATDDTLKVSGSASYVLELVDEEWKVVHLNSIHKMGE